MKKIKINPEVLIVIIITIPVLIWIFFAKNYLNKLDVSFGPFDKAEDLFETIFIFFIIIIVYFPLKSLRKRTQQAAKDYLQLFKINSVPMWIFDKKTLQFLLVNDAAVETYGYSREEFLAMTIKEIRPKEEWNKLDTDLKRNQIGYKDIGMWTHMKKDGSLLTVQITADNVLFQKKECRLISAHNVTALLEAEAGLKEEVKNKAAYQEIMQSAEQMANFGSWEFDITTQKVKCSDGIFRLFGYEPNSVEVSFDLCLTHIYPDDVEFVKEMYSQFVDKIFLTALNTDSSPNFAFRIIDKNSQLKYICAGLRIIRNDQNTPIRLRGFNLDITETQLSVEKLKKSHQKLQSLAAHLEDIREEERTDIAREIHDELGQQLTAIKFDISWVKTKLPQDALPVKEKITEAIEMVDETIRSVRRIASKLRPVILDELGLPAALKWQSNEFEKRTGIQCLFTENFNNKEIDKVVAIAFFRIFQEALTNVTRHSCATRVDSSLFLDDKYLQLHVTDNGAGFDPEEVKLKKSLGLVGLKERAIAMNAVLVLDSTKGKGTTITIKLPVNEVCKTEKT